MSEIRRPLVGKVGDVYFDRTFQEVELELHELVHSKVVSVAFSVLLAINTVQTLFILSELK